MENSLKSTSVTGSASKKRLVLTYWYTGNSNVQTWLSSLARSLPDLRLLEEAGFNLMDPAA
ncbi:hypothetical protein D3C85_1712950 [compost metagenome]